MFYISQDDAIKFWDYLEADLDGWERDTKMADELAKRQANGNGLDSFSLEWRATLEAKAIAIEYFRHRIQEARSGLESRDGEPMIVARIDGLLRNALGIESNSSNFTAANLVIDKAQEMKRKLISEAFRFSIKVMRQEVHA
jgi:hypothetical protein